MVCFSPLLTQIWVVFTILLMMVNNGMIIGIGSALLPALQASDSPVKADMDQITWLTAAIGVGRVITAIGSTYLLAKYGRRGAILICLAPALAGSLICYFVSNINILIFGRFLNGVGTGAGLLGVITIGEYATPKHRGMFLNMKSAALCLGFAIVHILCTYLHWRTVTIINIVLYIVTFVMAYTWPESPAWFASQKRFEECKNNFYLLRGKSDDSTKELVAMISAQKELPFVADRAILTIIVLFFKKFTKINFLKPVIVYFFVAMVLELSGRHVFPAYALKIIYELGSNKDNAFYYTLGIDLIMCASAVISTIFVKMMKRRTLLFYSGVSSIVILLAVCLYYYLQSMSWISKKYDGISIFLFGLYFGIVNVGCTPICLALLGEIFPLEHRPTCMSLGGLFISLFMIILLKLTPLMIDVIKIYGTFSVYAICMGIAMLILYFILPETKDKTLQEIEDYFLPNPRQTGKDEEENSSFIFNRRGKITPPFRPS